MLKTLGWIGFGGKLTHQILPLVFLSLLLPYMIDINLPSYTNV
jgi:hypothetical protein